MQATNELRFVEREIVVKPMTVIDPTYTTKIVRILQQKWIVTAVYRGTEIATDLSEFEWHDVPVEKEE